MMLASCKQMKLSREWHLMKRIIAIELWTLNKLHLRIHKRDKYTTEQKRRRRWKKHSACENGDAVNERTNVRTITWTTKIVNRIKSTWSAWDILCNVHSNATDTMLVFPRAIVQGWTCGRQCVLLCKYLSNLTLIFQTPASLARFMHEFFPTSSCFFFFF